MALSCAFFLCVASSMLLFSWLRTRATGLTCSALPASQTVVSIREMFSLILFLYVTCGHTISGCLTQPQIHWLKRYMLLSLFHTPFLFPFPVCRSHSLSSSLTVCKHPVLPVHSHSCSFPSSSPHINVSHSGFFAHSCTARASIGDVPLVCAGGSKVPLVGSRSWLITFSSRRLSPKMNLKKKQRWRSRKRK